MKEDRFAQMVRAASFNPFNITCDPGMQNTTHVPDIRTVMINELNNLYDRLSMTGLQNDKETSLTIVKGYAFNLVEQYYNNAGYVPKNSLDEILEQTYDAMKRTGFRNAFATLDDFKYHLYYGFLHP